MNLNNNNLTNIVDLSSVFISKPPFGYTSSVSSLYSIRYDSSDFPLTSISLPNLTTLTKINDGNSKSISISNQTIKKFSAPNLINIFDNIAFIQVCTNLEEIDISGLTHSNYDINRSEYQLEKLRIFNLDNLIECNGYLTIPESASMSEISLPSLIKVNQLSTYNSGAYDSLESIYIPNLTTVDSLNIKTSNAILATFSIGNFLTASTVSIFGLQGYTSAVTLNSFLGGYYSSVYINQLSDSIGIEVNSMTQSNILNFSDNISSTYIECVSLLNVFDSIVIYNNTDLDNIDLSSIINIYGSFTIQSNPSLTAIYLGDLELVSGNLNFNGNTILSNISIGGSLDCLSVSITSCDLSVTTVNNILIALDTAGYSNGTVDLSGGTSATPTGGGVTAAANLVIKGWTVTTN